VHLALTATCQKTHAQPAASIGLLVVNLQVNVARSSRSRGFPVESDQSKSLNDRRGPNFLPPFAISTFDKSRIGDREVNGKIKNMSCAGKQGDIIPETKFESYFVRSL
jgi:hypothetical protein